MFGTLGSVRGSWKGSRDDSEAHHSTPTSRKSLWIPEKGATSLACVEHLALRQVSLRGRDSARAAIKNVTDSGLEQEQLILPWFWRVEVQDLLASRLLGRTCLLAYRWPCCCVLTRPLLCMCAILESLPFPIRTPMDPTST